MARGTANNEPVQFIVFPPATGKTLEGYGPHTEWEAGREPRPSIPKGTDGVAVPVRCISCADLIGWTFLVSGEPLNR